MDVLLAVSASHLNRCWGSLEEQPGRLPSESAWPLMLRLLAAMAALAGGVVLLTLG